MKPNDEVWYLYQIFDVIMERWSPIYCESTVTALNLAVAELVRKQRNRPIVVRYIGQMCEGDLIVGTELNDVAHGSLEEYIEETKNEHQR